MTDRPSSKTELDVEQASTEQAPLEWSAEEERAIVRKQDLHLMPLLWALFMSAELPPLRFP